ncbi:hypothetical protein CKO45_16865 [Paracraurococcus ruber]|uniref:Uncharacterized protein n=1 Tax=Paracraurococcus ruber TaxID=77675 RepID=A0ABS1CZN1_9PROT|nr:hypothetical protein [Paracraurococcus ruber]
MRPSGSRAPLITRIRSSATGFLCVAIACRLLWPMPCSAEKLPPSDTAMAFTSGSISPARSTQAGRPPCQSAGACSDRWMLPSPAWPMAAIRPSGQRAFSSRSAALTKSGTAETGTAVSVPTEGLSRREQSG